MSWRENRNKLKRKKEVKTKGKIIKWLDTTIRNNSAHFYPSAQLTEEEAIKRMVRVWGKKHTYKIKQCVKDHLKERIIVALITK